MATFSLLLKNQITLLDQLVRRWDFKQGDGLIFFEDGDSVRVLPMKSKSLSEMRGSVKPGVSIKSMDALRRIAREEHASLYEHRTS